uniref:Uncharacterized protein n=1 Tax=Amphimedon queenslandica TaxID=400682 RepID=A0A1X7VSX8_AMPQE
MNSVLPSVSSNQLSQSDKSQLKFSISMPSHASALLWLPLREARLSEMFIFHVLSFHHKETAGLGSHSKNDGPSTLNVVNGLSYLP